MTDTPPSALRPLRPDLVSVQSQVVYGRVGNNVAVPTLESLGLSVAAVPTVVFSNTPHYPTAHGGALPIEWFEGYLQDLSARGALHALRAILVGYLGNPGKPRRWPAGRRPCRPSTRACAWSSTPVMGDHDHGIYVDEGMAEAYRQLLLPPAHGLTPNGFELAHLTGRPVDDVESLVAVARTLLTGRTQWIAVTSAASETWVDGEMQVVFVTRAQAHVITHARIDAVPKGTGDLFSAALTGYWLNGATLPEAIARACQMIAQALRHTQNAQCAELVLTSRVPNPQADSLTQARELDRIRQAFFESH